MFVAAKGKARYRAPSGLVNGPRLPFQKKVIHNGGRAPTAAVKEENFGQAGAFACDAANRSAEPTQG
jgi:hypothetical protein